MLGRLVVKLLFKACVPLVAVAGVMTYGVYLKGGDPAGLWKHVASGAFGKAGDMFSQAKNDAAGLAGSLTEGGVAGALGSGGESTQVYTWKDADGVTHFGTAAPSGINVETLTVNPNVNVLAPVVAAPAREDTFESDPDALPGSALRQARQSGGRSPNGPRDGRSGNVNQAVQHLESEMGEPLPGIAGHILSSGAAGGNGMDPSQLVRLLQSGGQ